MHILEKLKNEIISNISTGDRAGRHIDNLLAPPDEMVMKNGKLEEKVKEKSILADLTKEEKKKRIEEIQKILRSNSRFDTGNFDAQDIKELEEELKKLEKEIKEQKVTSDVSYKDTLNSLVEAVRESFSSSIGYVLTEEQAKKAVVKYGKKLEKLSKELLKLGIDIENIK